MSLAKQIEEKLTASFAPEYIDVQCESHMHNVPEGSEMHFRVVLVSEAFHSLGKVQRHQAVYSVLGEEMAGPIHALALHVYAPDEWEGEAPVSPECQGGGKNKGQM
ncbi:MULTISPECIES: BolA family transcriptional regulator [unclassified Microbulbifer]|uniref:BolA/IbaG family iron-sulfur metabolism protein n=1 Tax=Microbulbifer spongiae TaxID=2944933 RepID=A0ABY9ECP6_9GAMM|nr:MULTISPECIES: BolA/IbaG family iron-sulfur metabolism protein [unclassified Microbulbifer]MDP5209521.1 BolA/IbaG family iron-sulfur metabolism protein [Microbulbifer sp. 2205BS26-8]WKD50788.1 BolA/IbaG family iron-sulfur metabolism protein [Microbulbifer sp. MI-G]